MENMKTIAAIIVTIIFIQSLCFTNVLACNDELKKDVIEGLKVVLKSLKPKELFTQCCVHGIKFGSVSKNEFIKVFHECFQQRITEKGNIEYFEKLQHADLDINVEGVNISCIENFPKDFVINFKEFQCKSVVREIQGCLSSICLDMKEANKDKECVIDVVNVICDLFSEEL